MKYLNKQIIKNIKRAFSNLTPEEKKECRQAELQGEIEMAKKMFN